MDMGRWRGVMRRGAMWRDVAGATVDCIEELRNGDRLCISGYRMRAEQVEPKYFGEGTWAWKP